MPFQLIISYLDYSFNSSCLYLSRYSIIIKCLPERFDKFNKLTDIRNKSYITYDMKTICVTRLFGLLCGLTSMISITDNFNIEATIKNLSDICNTKLNELPYWETIQDVFIHLDINELRDIQKYFSYESKAYSKRKIQKLIKLQEYKPNGINILRLYLKSYKNHEKVTLKKEKLNFDILVLQNLVDLKNHI